MSRLSRYRESCGQGLMWVMTFLILLATATGMYQSWQGSLSEYYHWQTLELNDSFHVVITADGCWELVQSMSCEVFRDDVSMGHSTAFTINNENHDSQFDFITTPAGDIYGIFEVNEPDVILYIFDVTDTDAWKPDFRQNESYQARGHDAQTLLERLKKAYPGRKFVFRNW